MPVGAIANCFDRPSVNRPRDELLPSPLKTNPLQLADLIAAWHGIELPSTRAAALAAMLDEFNTVLTAARADRDPTALLTDFYRALSDFPDSRSNE